MRRYPAPFRAIVDIAMDAQSMNTRQPQPLAARIRSYQHRQRSEAQKFWGHPLGHEFGIVLSAVLWLCAGTLVYALLSGCGLSGPLPVFPNTTTEGGSGEGSGSDSSGSGSSGSSGTAFEGESTSGSTGESSGGEPVGLHEPCDPMADVPCDAPLICYQDSISGTLTFCTPPCSASAECPGVESWAMEPVCGDDGLCRNPCDEVNAPPLCPPGWECLYEGIDEAGSQVFNCLPFECPEEPC